MKEIDLRDPNIRLVSAYRVNDPVEAELIKNSLVEHGIPSALDGEHQAGLTGTLHIDILVREGDAEKAREVIEIHFANYGETGEDSDEEE